MLDDLLAQAVLHGEASKVADPAAVNLKTVEDALARGQADKANKFWYVLQKLQKNILFVLKANFLFKIKGRNSKPKRMRLPATQRG